MEVLSYDEVLKRTSGGRRHLLLGNGFSIACDPMFRYERLYEFAKQHGLNERVLGVFEYLGTNDFEGVMRLLQDADWIVQHYGLGGAVSSRPTPFSRDLESVKEALLVAITETHLGNPNEITDERKSRCAEFLRPYHNVFTTNYDLLLYWVEMSDEALQGGDGFRSDEDCRDALYVVFSEHLRGQPGIFFLHGALHLYFAEGQIRKHTWVRTGKPLIDSVRESLAQGQYPIFVAEGTAARKLEQIRRNGYLSYCLDKLGMVESPVVVLGLSLGASDQHIAQAIAHDRRLPRIYVGLFGDPTTDENEATRRRVQWMQERRLAISGGRVRKPLEVEYFDSGSAHIWD